MIDCLRDLKVGAKGRVIGLCCRGPIRRRLLDIGLTKGTVVECLGRAPSGDPSAFWIRGAAIAIRGEDSRYILIEEVEEWD